MTAFSDWEGRFEGDWAVVAACDVLSDGAGEEGIGELVAGEPVIETPADVSGASTGAVAPP